MGSIIPPLIVAVMLAVTTPLLSFEIAEELAGNSSSSSLSVPIEEGGISENDKEEAQDDHDHTFSYEFMSPQNILTGCSGIKLSSGVMNASYFFVDATGTRKFISPNQPAEVVFPTPQGLVTKQEVNMAEMCFPSACKVQGFCDPSENGFRAPFWPFPSISWPWSPAPASNSSQDEYFFNLTSQGNGSLSTGQGHLTVGFTGNAEAGKDPLATPPKDPEVPELTNGWGSHSGHEPGSQVPVNGWGPPVKPPGHWEWVNPDDHGAGSHSPPTNGWDSYPPVKPPGHPGGHGPGSHSPPTSGWDSYPIKPPGHWEWVHPGGNGQGSHSPPPAGHGQGSHSPPPPGHGQGSHNSPPAGHGQGSHTSPPVGHGQGSHSPPPPGHGQGSPNSPPAGHGQGSHNSPTNGWSSPPKHPPSGWGGHYHHDHGWEDHHGWGSHHGWAGHSLKSPENELALASENAAAASSDHFVQDAFQASAEATGSRRHGPPSKTSITSGGQGGSGWTTTVPPTTTITETPEETTTATEAPTTTTPETGTDCPGKCDCCDKCPISKLMDKLILSGYGKSASSVSGGHGGSPTPTQGEKIVNSARHYASIPGSIRGDVPVIYYPSCNPNAYYQPAIINYCTGWGRDDFKR